MFDVTFPKFSIYLCYYFSKIFTPSFLLPFHNFHTIFLVTFAQFSHHLCSYLCAIFVPSLLLQYHNFHIIFVVTFPQFSHHLCCYLSTIFMPSLLLSFHCFHTIFDGNLAQFSHYLWWKLCTASTYFFLDINRNFAQFVCCSLVLLILKFHMLFGISSSFDMFFGAYNPHFAQI